MGQKTWQLARCVVMSAIPALVVSVYAAQSSSNTTNSLSLEQAESFALEHHPRLAAAKLRAGAASQHVREARSAYFPTVAGNLTGTVVADPGTAIAAGNLTTSSISNRFAAGGALLQLVTDFGRTSALVQTARFRALAQGQLADQTREQVVLSVQHAYFRVLASEAVLKATQEALENRRLIVRQVTALQQSQLKSTLDVSFAEVLESEAELAVYRAQNTVHESRAELGAAMGREQSVEDTLTDVQAPPGLEPDPDVLVRLADQHRPDLLALESSRNAAHQFERAEKDLRNPTVNALAAAGEIPEHDHTLHDNYAAAGVNINIPVFNGGLFRARREEAGLQAQAEDKDVEDLRLQIAREVRDAWFEANDAAYRIPVTARLVEQSRRAQHLAQARYDNGLGSIVELNEAQLNETAAQIEAASATYDYLSKRADLDYATGVQP
jgi:outer membrane protein